MGWWVFIRSAMEALTRPRANVDACDRTIGQLTRESAVGVWLDRLADLAWRSWAGSGTRALSAAAVRALPLDSASGWRSAGWIAVVAAATALGLDAVKPVPVGPLSWLLPTFTGVAGLAVMAMAAPLARATVDRRRRDAVLNE